MNSRSRTPLSQQDLQSTTSTLQPQIQQVAPLTPPSSSTLTNNTTTNNFNKSTSPVLEENDESQMMKIRIPSSVSSSSANSNSNNNINNNKTNPSNSQNVKSLTSSASSSFTPSKSTAAVVQVVPVSGVAAAAAASSSSTSSSSHSLNWWRLSAIAFVFTSCGPFGIEACVISGGAAYTLATIFITPLVYVIPQVLMVSELSMMMPSNHGHIAWVERGWGRMPAAFNAYNSLLTNSIDLSLYPVLGGNYVVAHFLPNASNLAKIGVRVAMVLVGFVIAIRSAKVVSDAAVTVSLLVIVPFIFLFLVSIPRISPSTQWNYNPNSDGKVDWASFSAASLWLYTGWNSLGALGGDVEGGGSNRKIFVKGLSFALLWDILLYFFPLIAALVVPGGDWQDGYLSVAFGQILPGAGLLVSVCGVISTMGLFVSSLACYSRIIWGMADLGWLPRFLNQADPVTHAPVVATVGQVIAIVPLLFLSFSYLQRLEFCLAAVSYLLTFGSFLRLRYTEPDAHRPYLVPGGLPVAWLITVTKVLVFAFILASNFNDSSLMIGVVGVNGSIALGYWWYCRQNPSFAVSALGGHEKKGLRDHDSSSSSEDIVDTTSTPSPSTATATATADEKQEHNNNNDNNNVLLTKSDERIPFHPSEEYSSPVMIQPCGRAAIAADAIHTLLHPSSLQLQHQNQHQRHPSNQATTSSTSTTVESQLRRRIGAITTGSQDDDLDNFHASGAGNTRASPPHRDDSRITVIGSDSYNLN